MSDIGLTVCMLALVAVLGLWIGNWRIYGVGLGIGGVLFGGIVVGHFAQYFQFTLNNDMLHFIQVGPGFFSSLCVSGLRLNGFALLTVLLGCIVTIIIHKLFAVTLLIIMWILSGAMTNTPSLGAGQQILTDLGSNPAQVTLVGTSYAMAYPLASVAFFW